MVLTNFARFTRALNAELGSTNTVVLSCAVVSAEQYELSGGGGGAAAGGVFRVDNGMCELLHGGSCVRRPDGYCNSETCSIRTTATTTLAACPVFNTESGFDVLSIGGTDYHGMDCSTGVLMARGSEISWISDGSQAGDGWEVFAGPTAGAGELSGGGGGAAAGGVSH